MEWDYITILQTFVAIIGVLVSIVGVTYTWKTWKNTNLIKDSVKDAVRKERLFSESVELSKRLNDCRIKVTDPNTANSDLSQDSEFASHLQYICLRLKDLLKDDSVKSDQLVRISRRLDHLASPYASTRLISSVDPVKKNNSEYSMLIVELESVIKSGSVI